MLLGVSDTELLVQFPYVGKDMHDIEWLARVGE